MSSLKLLNNYISYFLSCYEADNRAFGVINFFSSKYENHYIIKEEELTNNKYPIQFIPEKHAKNCLQTLELFKNDKELIYSSLFCVGKRKSFQKKAISIVAPLFFYDASIKQKENEYYLRLNHESRRLNTAFVKSLQFKTSFDFFYTELELLLKKNLYIDFSFISAFKVLLEKHVSNLKEEVLLFPNLKTQTFLKNQLQQQKEIEQFTLFPAAGIFISSKSNNNDAVVNELTKLAKSNNFSKGLEAFFSDKEESSIDNVLEIKIPALLNNAQKQIIRNANHYSKSVIFGPPGTGKTYTISGIAQDFISRGKSVLIVSKTAQSLNVIEKKLTEFKLGNFISKIGGKYYRRRILSHLKKISNGFYHKKNTNSLLLKKRRNTYFDKLKYLEREFLNKIEKDNKRVERLFSDSLIDKAISEIDLNWFRDNNFSENKLIQEYFETLSYFEKYADYYLHDFLLENINEYSNSHRKDLIKLINIFETEEKALKNQQLESINFDALLHFLPIWLVKIDEISLGIPLQKNLFDIVIIDEATQCDIASCLPVFQRAKSIVVAGDTNQLRHISFLSVSQLLGFQKKFSIPNNASFNYRKKSLLDFVLEKTSENKQITLLDEHYRSLPEIIDFSNKTIYHSSLRIMTQTPYNSRKKAVFLELINGKQNSKGVNEEEAFAIIKRLKIIIKEQVDLSKNNVSSIGILCPFREQTNFLTKKIKETIYLEDIKKHQIQLGTPYHFQGEEKDIMLLSFVVDNDSHHASLNYLNKDDVFNVAITRARYQQYLFVSINPKVLKEDTLFANYLSSFSEKEALKTEEVISDSFSDEVIQYLQKQDCHTFLGFNIAGLFIDILVEVNQQYFGIDLIGYPGDFKEAFSLERYKIMHRVGIPIMPISFISWNRESNYVKGVLIKQIKKFSEIV
jgi:superfamily I DNA and/or RNA helicase